MQNTVEPLATLPYPELSGTPVLLKHASHTRRRRGGEHYLHVDPPSLPSFTCLPDELQPEASGIAAPLLARTASEQR
jgi:hypothetical protein